METREAWKGLTQEEQINYANKIAGQEAISGWNAIMNASEADVSKLADAISNADGAALQMANTMQDNLTGDVTIFKSALEGLQIQLNVRTDTGHCGRDCGNRCLQNCNGDYAA